jgi:hypothetical protein
VESHQFNAAPSILQRFQFEVDAGWTLEFQIETRFCSMDSNIRGPTARLRLCLRLSQCAAKGRCVTLSIDWAGVSGPLDPSKVRRIRLGRRCVWNEQMLAISRGWH